MISPIEKTGGVSRHTISIANFLRNIGAEVLIYNTSPTRFIQPVIKDVAKVYKKTIGCFFFVLRSNSDIIHIQAGGSFWGFIPAFFALLGHKLGHNQDSKFVVTYHGVRMIKLVKSYLNIARYHPS